MMLTPREQEKLLIYVAADLARTARARSSAELPEAALITEAMLEGARRRQQRDRGHGPGPDGADARTM